MPNISSDLSDAKLGGLAQLALHDPRRLGVGDVLDLLPLGPPVLEPDLHLGSRLRHVDTTVRIGRHWGMMTW